MMNTLVDHLNGLPNSEAIAELEKCCGSKWWCEQLAEGLPYCYGAEHFVGAVNDAFDRMPTEAWLEAFEVLVVPLSECLQHFLRGDGNA